MQLNIRSNVKAWNEEAVPIFYGKLYLNNSSTSCENESINNFKLSRNVELHKKC